MTGINVFLKQSVMFITICLLFLMYYILGKDVKPLLDKIKNVDWMYYINKAWPKLREYAKQNARTACEPILKLWFVLEDPNTETWEKALIYGAIIYVISPFSIIPIHVYKFLGILDEGAVILYVINKVNNKMTPAINNKVMDILDEWFGPIYTISDSSENI